MRRPMEHEPTRRKGDVSAFSMSMREALVSGPTFLLMYPTTLESHTSLIASTTSPKLLIRSASSQEDEEHDGNAFPSISI